MGGSEAPLLGGGICHKYDASVKSGVHIYPCISSSFSSSVWKGKMPKWHPNLCLTSLLPFSWDSACQHTLWLPQPELPRSAWTVVRENFPAESRNGHVRVHGCALYKQASTQSLQTLTFTDNSFLGLKYTCLKKGKRKSYLVTGSAAHMSRIKDIGIWNPRIRAVGIRNTDGWNPESRGLESGIQDPCGFCYMGRVCSNLSAKHTDNIFFPNVRELLKRRRDHFLVFGGSIYIWVCNKMTTERLSDLAVIAMHANTVTIDRRLAYEKFVALLPRRMMASSVFAD